MNLYCNICGEPGIFDSDIFWCKECKMYVHLGDAVETKVIKEVGQDYSTSSAKRMVLKTLECGHVLQRKEVTQHKPESGSQSTETGSQNERDSS